MDNIRSLCPALDDNYEIIFTSGQKENNSSIIYMTSLSYFSKRKVAGHIILSNTEHMDTINTCHGLKELGFVEYNYFENIDEIENIIQDNTCMIFISSANEDLGNITPIKSISQIAEQRNIPLYIDYTPTICYRLPGNDGFDMCSFEVNNVGCLVLDKKLIQGYNMKNIISRTDYELPIKIQLAHPTKKYMEFLRCINKIMHVCHYNKYNNKNTYPVEIVILGPELTVPRLDVLVLCIVGAIDVDNIKMSDVKLKTTFERYIPINSNLKQYMIGFDFTETKNITHCAAQLLKFIQSQLDDVDWKNSLR